MHNNMPKKVSFSGLPLSRKWRNTLVRQCIISTLLGFLIWGLIGSEGRTGDMIRYRAMSLLSVENDWTPVIQEVLRIQSGEEVNDTMVLPVSGIVVRNYGWHTIPGNKKEVWHNGIDIKAQKGESVKAASGGSIENVGGNKTKGYYVTIRHNGNVTTIYGNLDKVNVKSGQHVKDGEPIAEVGSGSIYFEIRVKGSAVDPLNYLRSNRDRI